MNVKETLRYLGYKGNQPDGQTLELVEECWQELEESVVKRVYFQEFPLRSEEHTSELQSQR